MGYNIVIKNHYILISERLWVNSICSIVHIFKKKLIEKENTGVTLNDRITDFFFLYRVLEFSVSKNIQLLYFLKTNKLFKLS